MAIRESAVKVEHFKLEKEVAPGGQYCITIFQNGIFVEEIVRATEREAHEALKQAGYIRKGLL